MRRSGKWMTIWDDRILEFLRENGPSSVGELTDSEYIRVSQPHVSRRCKRLAEHGFLDTFANGVYAITERGEAYLDGDLDARKDRPDETPDAGTTSSPAPGDVETENGT